MQPAELCDAAIVLWEGEHEIVDPSRLVKRDEILISKKNYILRYREKGVCDIWEKWVVWVEKSNTSHIHGGEGGTAARGGEGEAGRRAPHHLLLGHP